MINRQRYKPYF